MHYAPRLNQPYTPEDMETILGDALRVLEQLGIACGSRAVIDRMTATPGVRYDSGRLKFDPAVVREHVEKVRRRNAAEPNPEPEFQLLSAWCCLNYADPETGEVRPATTDEAARMTRLADAMGAATWSVPVVPGAVPPQLATVTAEYVALANSRKLGGFMPVMDSREIELLIEMNLAVGRTFHLVEQVSISPLRFNDHGLESALAFLGRTDCRVQLTGAIPTLGSTVPLSVRSALAETVAESLALSLAGLRLGFGAGGFGAELKPFDFQYATIGFGPAEESLLWAVSRQMAAFLNGRHGWFGSFHSMARWPDGQASSERAAGVLTQAFLGARRFRGAGQLAVDEIYSPQQAVIDLDILDHVARIVRGLDPLAIAGDVVEELAAGVAEGSFLGERATVKGYRQLLLRPKLFHHYNTGHWRNLGCPALLAESWQRAKELIDGNEFHLPEAASRDLDRIYRRATKLLA